MAMEGTRRIHGRWWLATLGVVIAAAAILLTMGRVPICECGTVRPVSYTHLTLPTSDLV